MNLTPVNLPIFRQGSDNGNLSSDTKETAPAKPQEQKRPCADITTISMQLSLKLVINGMYKSKNMKKYNIFMLCMENHFLCHMSWFTSKDAKITNEIQVLSDDLLLK